MPLYLDKLTLYSSSFDLTKYGNWERLNKNLPIPIYTKHSKAQQHPHIDYKRAFFWFYQIWQFKKTQQKINNLGTVTQNIQKSVQNIE